MSGTSVTRFVYIKPLELFRLLSKRYQTFYYSLGRCYHRTKVKNIHFLFNLPPELPNKLFEKAIIEIDFIQQKSIVPSKLNQKSPLVEMASLISINIKI